MIQAHEVGVPDKIEETEFNPLPQKMPSVTPATPGLPAFPDIQVEPLQPLVPA